MSWMQKLYETYENCQADIGVENDENNVPLMPVAHIFIQAQIEIAINQDGDFKQASLIEKNYSGTIIPCTEESGGRSGSNPKSHPLCDKLQYIAKDFSKYLGENTNKQIKMYEEYRELLKKWCESNYSHAKIKAVLKYVENGSVTKDLIESKILPIEKNGKINKKFAGFVVRWIVYVPGEMESRVYRDKGLFEKWIEFDKATKREPGLCYITGENRRLAKNHPKYIRRPGDSAKLISSNDDTGFTFRGRFRSDGQACGIGFEVTQKAHNALRWLINRQGYRRGDLAVVAWSIMGKKVPDPLADPFFLLEMEGESDAKFLVATAQELAIKLNQKIAGYQSDLKNTSGVVIMALDSATPGRMAIIFYRELTESDFLHRVETWHKSCCWVHDYRYKEVIDKTTGKVSQVRVRFVGAPAPNDIAEAAYGRKIDDKLRKTTITRIIPCIVDGQKIPRDLVESTVRRAINRIGMEAWEWNKTLSIACALYRKYHEKENLEMALDEKRATRDYLYGRLLALADCLEDWALKQAGESRQTGAARLMQRFADYPHTTWRTIELGLGPYKARLGKRAIKIEGLISNVTAMFQVDDFTNNKRLSGEFLLGYHCQREALWHGITKE